jgi:AcrR family transcriptional regulator
MRYSQEYKEKARQRLLDSGGSHAKKHGFGGSGMDALAAAAGVTTGSLYKHFADKSDLFAAVIEAELRRTAKMFAAIDPGNREAATNALEAYLSVHHVKHPESGCPLPSLTSEVARADKSVRAAFESGVLDIHAILERFAASSDRAWALIAQSVGAVMLARAMLNEEARRDLLSAVAREGQRLLKKQTGNA